MTSQTVIAKTTDFNPPTDHRAAEKSPYVVTAAEAMENYRANEARCWHESHADQDDVAGKYAFQRLRHTWFTPKINPKFKLRQNDKFYAIGSCFARGIESALIKHNISVESAAPEFAKLQPVNKEFSGLGFTNKYNTFSILNELHWALDPDAVFPADSIVQLTKTTWYDPHTTPRLDLVDRQETLERRALLQSVTQRIKRCRAVIVTLGLAEVWRDVQADVYVNSTPLDVAYTLRPDVALPVSDPQPSRYEFHLTSFAQNLANLDAIHALLTQYGHPDFHVIITVSPVPLVNTFSTMDIVVANTWAKSLLRAVAQEWAAAHRNVDYFPSYEIVQSSDRAAAWERDLRHVKGAGAQHIMELFFQSYIE